MPTEILLSAERLAARIQQMGPQIRDHYGADEPLLLVGVLRGAVVFLADLMRAIPGPVECEFVAIESYVRTESSGDPRLVADIRVDLAGRHVIVVEDIVDTGQTLAFLRGVLAKRQPASIAVATLLDKPSRRVVDVDVEWVGFPIDDHFVVGFGLDLDGRYRNLPYVGVLT